MAMSGLEAAMRGLEAGKAALEKGTSSAAVAVGRRRSAPVREREGVRVRRGREREGRPRLTAPRRRTDPRCARWL